MNTKVSRPLGPKSVKISELGELGLIDRIRTLFDREADGVVKGIGDDAAVINTGNRNLTLITTDMLLEGVHFDLGYTSPHHLGEKALAVNISDIAAMGGIPRWALVSLGLPKDTEIGFVEAFYAGISDMAGRFGVTIIGGDTVASKENISINVVLLGEAAEDEVVFRSGAKVGDHIFVTGVLGDSAAGLELLKKGGASKKASDEYCSLINRHLTPTPRVKEARFLTGGSLVSSMIDISDGLIQDLKHICDESQVGAKVWLESVPLSDGYRRAGSVLGLDVTYPLAGGEDYELLFTVPVGKRGALDRMKALIGCNVTHIGDICEGHDVALYDSNDNIVVPGRYGYEHYKS